MGTKKILALVAAFAAIAASACGNKTTPLETVQNASSETAGEKTASIAMTITGSAGSLKDLTMTGAYDFDKRLLSFHFDASKLGTGGSGTIDAVMDFSDSVVQYMKLPGLEEEVGKAWMKIDVASAVSSVCPDIDFAALLQSQSGDPTAGLQMLANAKTVKELGKEKVRGAETTHYRVTVDIRDVAEKAPAEARETMRQMASWYIDPLQTTDVWIDGDGRARRSEADVDGANLKMPDCLSAAQSKNPFGGKTHVSFELFDFGKKVDIKVPAANDVVDIADLTN
jgi:hypothetical protein